MTLSPRDADKDGDCVMLMSHTRPVIGNIQTIYMVNHKLSSLNFQLALITKGQMTSRDILPYPGIRIVRSAEAERETSCLCCDMSLTDS